MQLEAHQAYNFERVALSFIGEPYTDVFAQKNNKTLAQTLEHHRYSKLKDVVLTTYREYLDTGLGKFLIHLKQNSDVFYKRFLNKYGDGTYSTFFISDNGYLTKKGIYAYCFDDNLVYIGRCKDSMMNRVNQGYGKIHPKNCYLDGQATNCHLNSLITNSKGAISLWLCPMESDEQIETIERELIRRYTPPWNIQKG